MGNRVVTAIWFFKRKRLPDWTISCHKARVCSHGGQQIEGVNYWDTYASVVNWSTTRLVLILSAISNLKTWKVDYVQAYTQADFDCDLYMHVPAGFAVVNNKHVLVDGLQTKGLPRQHVLKLKKNLDGLKQAGHNWFEKLHRLVIANLLPIALVAGEIACCRISRALCAYG